MRAARISQIWIFNEQNTIRYPHNPHVVFVFVRLFVFVIVLHFLALLYAATGRLIGSLSKAQLTINYEQTRRRRKRERHLKT